MQTERGNGLSQPGPHDAVENSAFETLSRVDRDVNDLIGAMALLGIKRCSQCRQFFRAAEPGALFENGQIVCYHCIPEWWASISLRLAVAEREKMEGKLASWLRKHRNAEVVKETPGKILDTSSAEFQIVARCAECAGSGKLMEGERCRFCNGFGSVRIVVPR